MTKDDRGIYRRVGLVEIQDKEIGVGHVWKGMERSGWEIETVLVI